MEKTEKIKDVNRFSGESICQSDDAVCEAPNLLGNIAEKVFKFQKEYDDE